MAQTGALFEAQMRFTGTLDYGFSMAQAAAGTPIPDQGARFDVTFKGEIRGDRLRGRIIGTDYVLLNKDGTPRLRIYARITSDDGHNIALYAEGSTRPRQDSALSDLHETITFSTAAPPYQWLNDIQAIGNGVVDAEKGEIQLTVQAS